MDDYSFLLLIVNLATIIFVIWAVLAHIHALRSIADNLSREVTGALNRIARTSSDAPPMVLTAHLINTSDGKTMIEIRQDGATEPAAVLITYHQSVMIARTGSDYRITWSDNSVTVQEVVDKRTLLGRRETI